MLQDTLPKLMMLEPLDIPRNDDRMRIHHRVDERQLPLQIRQFVQLRHDLVLERRQITRSRGRVLRRGRRGSDPVDQSICRTWQCVARVVHDLYSGIFDGPL